MLDLGSCLRHYKRLDVQRAMVEAAKDKEVSVRYIDGGFGKRPDVLVNNSDILENVKQKTSSFHCSEELWINPMQISTGMRKDDLERLRIGWDLVLDIDCPIWELSKITTWLFIEALKAHGIKSISLKFSGNKGFHIGVPFKAFPGTVPGKDILTKDYFPEGPRRIAAYLVNYIENHLIRVDNNKITFGNKIEYTFDQLKQLTGKDMSELTHFVLNGKKVKKLPEKSNQVIKQQYQCSRDGAIQTFDAEQTIVTCKNCNSIMNNITPKQTAQKLTNNLERKFNPLSIVEVDTVLIAPRHLYRMVYSMHEKSGLVSIPIAIDRVLLFEKDEAKQETIAMSSNVFLDDTNTIPGEAELLLKDAFDFNPIIEQTEEEKRIKKAFIVGEEQITQKIPEELFPPCIKLLLGQLKDGKKRALFSLVNFLHSVGWNYDEIKERLDEWNKIQEEPMRETILLGQVNYHKTQKKDVLPQNCPQRENNVPLQHQQNIYTELQVCRPDGLCAKIKNPIQYAKKRAWLVNQDIVKVKTKKTTQDKIRCQSCGMPVGEFEVNNTKQDNFGREVDGSITKEYCSFCYKNGKFVEPNLNVDDMIAKSIEHMTKRMSYPKEKAEELSNKIIPQLRRWKQQ